MLVSTTPVGNTVEIPDGAGVTPWESAVILAGETAAETAVTPGGERVVNISDGSVVAMDDTGTPLGNVVTVACDNEVSPVVVVAAEAPVPPAGLLVGTTPGGNVVEIPDGACVTPCESEVTPAEETAGDTDVMPCGKLVVNIPVDCVVGIEDAVTPLDAVVWMAWDVGISPVVVAA